MSDRPKLVEIATSLNDWGSIERYVVTLARGLETDGWETCVVGKPDSPIAKHARNFCPQRFSGKYGWTVWPSYVRLLKGLSPDIVHVHFSPDFLIPVLATKAAKARKTVLTRHLTVPWSPRKAKALAKRIDRFVGVSQAVSRTMESSGIPSDRITTVLSGLETPTDVVPQPTEVRQKLGWSDEDFHVGFFGRVVEVKGVEIAVRSVSGLQSVKLHVFGSGPDVAAVKAKSTGSPVHFYGSVAPVWSYLQAVDAVVVPSLWEEAFAFSVLEAMSMGKPVLASRVGGIPEAVEDGRTGILFPKGDDASLREAILRLAGSRALAQEMGQEGKRVFNSRFTLRHMCSRYDTFLRSLI